MTRILLVAGLALAGVMALAGVFGQGSQAEPAWSRADSVLLPPPLNTCSI